MSTTDITFRAITEAFLQMEEALDLFDQQVDGVYFWERIRFPLHQEILKRTGVIGQAHTKLKRTAANRRDSILRTLRNVFAKNPYFAPESEILFLGSPRRKLRYDDKWWDIYCDPIIDCLDKDYVYVEHAYLNTHLTPAKTKNIRYLDLPFTLARVRRKFSQVKFTLSDSERELLEDIRERITEQFDVVVDLEEIVTQSLRHRKGSLPIYQRLLEKISPKLVFVVCSYGQETFTEACKTLGVPVVELQHGVISPYHLGYSFSGYKRTKRTFPDYLFAFGDFWKESTEFPIEQERIYSVGYPYLEDERKRFEKCEKKDQLIFISQGTVGKEMSKFAVQLAKREDFPLRIVYKLHPGEYARWRQEYPWLIESDIHVVEDDSISLYQLFAESKIQVGVNSTAIFEGLNFDLKTIVLDLPGVAYMEYLIKEGVARVVTSPEELVETLHDHTTQPILTERFFKRNALDNIKQVIDDILNAGATDEDHPQQVRRTVAAMMPEALEAADRAMKTKK